LSIRAPLGLSKAGLLGAYIAVDGANELSGGVTMKPVSGDPDTWRGKWTFGDVGSSVTIARQPLPDLDWVA